jgi:predicted acylesterase/phospholipase RssA
MPDNNQKPFYIGLCLAGAVSAGAYTAGVIDYLIEALQEWQKRKDANEPGTPSHDVIIPVIGGASAGGMTGIITATAINNPITPVTKPSADLVAEHPENKFYHSWVDLIGPDMFPMMLATDDIKEGGIISLLNSNFIDQIAEQVIQVDADKWQEAPRFFDPQLQVFTTLTNLNGFSYNVSFRSNVPSNKYYMSVHNDFACFKLHSKSEEEDGWMHLDFRNKINNEVARDAAMATGAFPVGLRSRKLTRKSGHINKIPWCLEITKDNPVKDGDYETLNVDGGMINNEPFEKVRDVLKDRTGQTNSQDYQDFNKFESTVLMVDPFPSTKPGAFDCDGKLFKVIGQTFNAMMQQIRAKPRTLCDALDAGKAGQFLIAPSRKRPRIDGTMEDVAGDKAIACGAFDGFSGFMNKEFRVHDYFLGRFNCEMFLRNYFTIPAEAIEQNEIFRSGYEGTDKSKFRGADGSYQIIPIFSPAPAADHFPIPKFSNGSNWPVIPESKIDAFRPHVKKRVQALIMNAVKIKGFNRFLLWMGSLVLLNRVLTNNAMSTIKQALMKHHLMKRETN